MFPHWRLTATCCAILLGNSLLGQACGDDTQPAEKLPVVSISSVPQPEPSPPLKYMLIPQYSELQPGNAASCYYRAILMLPRDKEQRYGDQQSEWIDGPLEQFPREIAREWLKPYHNSLKELGLATYREQCDWDRRVQQLSGTEAVSLLLPELQELRELARVLRVKSRLEIAEGRFDDACETLVTGYQMATNLSGSSILITDLVAVAIAGLMNSSVVDWIDADGPNLYWGLASLPQPMVNLRKSLQQEMHFPIQLFPFLKDPESLVYTPEQWRQVIGESIQQMGTVTSGSKPTANLLAQTAASGLILAGYSQAKQALIEEGMDPKRVEAMPAGQVIAIRTARVYREVYHESIKWTFVPYAQSYRQMTESVKRMREKGYVGPPAKIPGVVPVFALFLPAVESAALAPVRMQRELAALQTIEALRMAAADSAGKLPGTLAELERCPVPADPVTGNPFIYKLEGGKAVLELPPPEGRNAETFGKRYEVTLGAKQ